MKMKGTFVGPGAALCGVIWVVAAAAKFGDGYWWAFPLGLTVSIVWVLTLFAWDTRR